MRGKKTRVEEQLLFQCLRLILKPAVCFCLRHSLKLQGIIECLKLVYLDAAREQLAKNEQRVTDSRLHVMTGVHRRDIVRFKSHPPAFDKSKSLITKVLGQWQSNERFRSKDNRPAVLSVGSEESEFNHLVRTVNTDLNPATVLFELERVHAVERVKSGAKLVVKNYIPKGDPVSGFRVFRDDFADMLAAVEQNVLEEQELPNHHLRTEFDRIRPQAVAEIKHWFLREGHELHLRAREFLARFDQDLNPDSKFQGETVRVAIGSFSLVEEDELTEVEE